MSGSQGQWGYADELDPGTARPPGVHPRVRTPRGEPAPPGVGGHLRGTAVTAPGGREGRAARGLVPGGGRRPGRHPARLGGDAGGVLRGRWFLWPGSRAVHGRDRAAAHGGPRDARADRQRSSAPRWPGEKIGSLAITEPGGGSDVAAIRTTATRDGDSFVVNGAKTFITSGVRADFVTTAVRTGGPGHAGVSLLVVEKGTPGFTVDRALSQDGLALLGHRRALLRRRACPGGEPGRRGEHRLLPDRRAVRGRADRPRRTRLRDRRPLAGPDGGVLPGTRDLRQAADRQPGGAAQARRDAPAGRGRADLHPSRRRAPRRRGR